MLIQSRYTDIPSQLEIDLIRLPLSAPDSAVAAFYEYLLQEESLALGCEMTLAQADARARTGLTWCEVCEDMYHENDLVPCGPSPRTCPNCVTSYPGDVEDPFYAAQ